MGRIFFFGLALAVGMATSASAQDNGRTLADIRQDLTVLNTEVQRLRRELSTTGAATVPAGAGSMLQRLDAIEAQLTRLTAQSEQLEFRVNRVVADGSNQIGDLNFRLCEVEPGCDIGALPELPILGGEASAPAPIIANPIDPTPATGGGQLAVGEQAAFDTAMEKLSSGDLQAAADGLGAFVETYPVGDLTVEAHYQRGVALKQLGQTSGAARAFLEGFSADPNGRRAPDALFNLGISLGDLGQTRESCVTLGEVGVRFPGSVAATDANAALTRFGCS